MENNMRPIFLLVLALMTCGVATGSDYAVPAPEIQAPVAHVGKFCILNSGGTSLILDGSRGMSITMLREKEAAFLQDASLEVELILGEKRILLDQSFDSNPRLQIISQGPTHVAARAFFRMYSQDGCCYGTGSLDFYLYSRRIHLVPSVFIDYFDTKTKVSRAGFFVHIPEKGFQLEVKDKPVVANNKKHFQPFGEASEDFHLTVIEPSGLGMKIGWLRNVYPNFIYLREVDKDPERDELYEKWPPWISQKGAPLGWRISSDSALEANFSSLGLEGPDFLWVNKEPIPIPKGSYKAFNGVMAIFLGKTKKDAANLWDDYQNPLKPAVTKGDFRFFNEIEGIYEVDSKGEPVDLTFDTAPEKNERPVVFRFWNLEGKGACLIKVNDQPVPLTLMNEGGLVEDPMVSIVKEACGPAYFAVVSFIAPASKKTRLTLTRRPGLQFTYQMYSDLETYELWSDNCPDQPLFRLHLKEGAIYKARFPGKKDFAFFKLPLYWMKNGVNPSTFMNRLCSFSIEENGPEKVRFILSGDNLLGTGHSTYSCEVPFEHDKLTLQIQAEFKPLDDGQRWSSLEYCDLYPFDNVYRRNFHYQDVLYLARTGVFERVGTGAWDHYFKMIEEPERLGYYAEYLPREGPGSKIPHPSDGSVWILGNNPERGNIFFRRQNLQVSEGTESAFSLCNAWVDIHNVLVRLKPSTSMERVSYVIEIFGGDLPSLEELNRLYLKATKGKQEARRMNSVVYGREGKIIGFEVEKE